MVKKVIRTQPDSDEGVKRYTDAELRDSYRLLEDQRALNEHCRTNGRLDVEYVVEQDAVARELQRRGAL
ncbi:hypothetical protein ADL21_04545 [Streptomyces albus subsp. albus]|nr:hypothetical protein ADL21_04545 [Streptomyces albus subsp. albus]